MKRLYFLLHTFLFAIGIVIGFLAYGLVRGIEAGADAAKDILG